MTQKTRKFLFIALFAFLSVFFVVSNAEAHQFQEGRTTWSHSPAILAGYGIPFRFPERWDVHCSDVPKVDPYLFPAAPVCRGMDVVHHTAHFTLYATVERSWQSEWVSEMLEHLGHLAAMQFFGPSGEFRTNVRPEDVPAEACPAHHLKGFIVSIEGTVGGDTIRHSMHAVTVLFERKVEYMVRLPLQQTQWPTRTVYFTLFVYNRGVTGRVDQAACTLFEALQAPN